MLYLVLIMPEHENFHEAEKRYAEFGFRKFLASEDKKVALQLPYPVLASMREGESAEEIRNGVMAELKEHETCAFVLVAEHFACGRV